LVFETGWQVLLAAVKIILIGIVAFVAAVSVLEPHFIELVKTEFYSPKLPRSFDGFKLVFVSDIHRGPTVRRRRLRKIVKIINSTKADVALFGGDYVYMARGYLLSCFKELKSLDSRLLKFGVLGNHDHWESASLARRSMRSAGINLLDNRAEWIYKGGERIRIGGLADLWEDTPDIAPMLEGVGEEDFVVAIAHNPDVVELFPPDKVDLLIAGHTHGGQITLFRKLFFPVSSEHGNKYAVGIVKAHNNTTVVISNGVGTGAFPGRFFARPQINLVTLRREETK
jgi:predicted MPP superfamily phosphohydrolase